MGGMEIDVSADVVVACFVSGSKKVYALPHLRRLKQTKNDLHGPPPGCLGILKGSLAVSGAGDRSIHVLRFRGGASADGLGASCWATILIVLLFFAYFLLLLGVKAA